MSSTSGVAVRQRITQLTNSVQNHFNRLNQQIDNVKQRWANSRLPAFLKPSASSAAQITSASNGDLGKDEKPEIGPDGKEIHGIHKGDENEERGNWSSQAEFIISCIGFAVGLGNVWRFPYMCYRNGGGAFLVIYWILSACVGFPIIVLEQSIGQYTSMGPLHCWQFTPIITGVGMSMVAVSFLTVIYYDIVITWSAFYMFASFTSELPWSKCDYSSWADYRCEMSRVLCLNGTDEIRGEDGLCYNASFIGYYPPYGPSQNFTDILSADSFPHRNTSTVIGFWNETLAKEWKVQSLLAPAEYYHNYALGDGSGEFGLSNMGPPRWGLVLCLAFVWVLVYLSLMNGIKSSGKIVYFTCIAPYVVLFIFIVRGATLPGAYDGIMYFLTPDFERIKRPEVWYAAAGQLFYSLSACWGGMVTLASYNRFHNNIVRDALIVVFADTFTSFIASFAIFSVIGYGAYILDRPVDQVVEAGTGLAFIVYPKVLLQLPGSVGFSIIFFFMCICLGLDSEFNMSETVFTALLDLYPSLRKDLRTKSLTFAAFCVICFLLGLPFVCSGGPKLLNVFDSYCATWAILLMGILETVSICWIYGFRCFTKDLKLMMPWLPIWPTHILAVALWGIITPGVLGFIMFFIWIKYEPDEDSDVEGLGWFLTWFVAIWMPAVAVWVIVRGKGNPWQRIVAAFRPSSRWGPYLQKFRKDATHLSYLYAAETSADSAAPAETAAVATPSSTWSVIHKDQKSELPTGSYQENQSVELTEWHARSNSAFEEDPVTDNSVVWASSTSRIVIEGYWVQKL